MEAEKQMQSFLAEVNLSKGRNRRKVEQSKTLNCKANPISSSIDTPSATISKEDISPKTSSNVPTNLEVAPKQSIESNVGGLDSTKSKYPKPSMPPPREQESLKASKSSSEDPIPRPSSVKDSRRPQSSTQAYRIYEDDSEESEEESDSDSAMGTEEQEEVDIPVPNLYAPPSEPPPVLVTAPLAIVDGKDEVPDALLAHASGNAEIGECADSIESDANSEFFAREIKDLQDRSKTLQDILIKTEGSLASTSVEVPSISPSHPYVKYAPKPPGASGPPAVAPESMSPNAYTHFQLDAGSIDTTYRPETIQLSPRHAPDYLSEDDEEEVESDDGQETATVDFGAKDHKKEEELTEVSNPSADSNPLESSGNKTSTKVSQGADPVAVNYSLDEIDSDDSDDESEEENSNSNSAPILSEAVAIKPINSVSPGETLVVPSTPLGVVQERHDGYDTPPCTSGDMQNFGPSSGDGFKSTLSTPRTARGLLASVAAVKDVLRQAKRCQHKNDMVETEKLFTKALDMVSRIAFMLQWGSCFIH